MYVLLWFLILILLIVIFKIVKRVDDYVAAIDDDQTKQLMIAEQQQIENNIEDSIIRQFENDLRSMSAEDVRQAYREATETIDEIVPWQEALSIHARRNCIDLD